MGKGYNKKILLLKSNDFVQSFYTYRRVANAVQTERLKNVTIYLQIGFPCPQTRVDRETRAAYTSSETERNTSHYVKIVFIASRIKGSLNRNFQ